jgi:IS5 family transposase
MFLGVFSLRSAICLNVTTIAKTDLRELSEASHRLHLDCSYVALGQLSANTRRLRGLPVSVRPTFLRGTTIGTPDGILSV